MDYSQILGLLFNNPSEQSPSNGGLNASNYPNPYGLRAYPLQDKSGNVTGYGGEFLPKSVGWLGLLEGKGKGQTVTEYSLDDAKGSYPSVVPTLDMYERDSVARGIVTPEIARKAAEWRDLMQSQGQSPFYNATGMK
jgi:hypothetical protein